MSEPRSFFERLADRVSYIMGTPANISIWLVLVIAWFFIFATGLVSADANFMPRWFTGTSFNFPLNTITTLAELYIGFLVGAATNRSERHATTLLDRVATLEAQNTQILSGEIDELKQHREMLVDLRLLLEENTRLTKRHHE